MPPGAKKRKALKKKQQEAIASTNNSKGFNGDHLQGHSEHGSQDERDSDSNLNSPGSETNDGGFGSKDPSSPLSSPVVNGASKEISGSADVTQELGKGKDDKKNNIVEKLPDSSSGNFDHTSRNVACQEPYGSSASEIAPALDSAKPKSEKTAEYPSPGTGKDDSKVVTLPGSAAETSQKIESVRVSEIPVSSEEKHVLLPGPPVIQRTSWLSCCGLFEVMSSER